MNTAKLDLKSAQYLTINVDHLKNFSVILSGFDNIDTLYTLSLKKKGALDEKIFLMNSDIIVDPVGNTITLVFNGADYDIGSYCGILESNNKNIDFFYKNSITVNFC